MTCVCDCTYSVEQKKYKWIKYVDCLFLAMKTWRFHSPVLYTFRMLIRSLDSPSPYSFIKLSPKILIHINGTNLPPIANSATYFILPDLKFDTEPCQMTFYPDAVSNWNNTITFFSRNAYKCSFEAPCGIPYQTRKKSTIGIRWLYMFRLGLFLLRHHKKRHNSADTTYDLCIFKTFSI